MTLTEFIELCQKAAEHWEQDHQCETCPCEERCGDWRHNPCDVGTLLKDFGIESPPTERQG